MLQEDGRSNIRVRPSTHWSINNGLATRLEIAHLKLQPILAL
jgi:hypothetical protein